MKLILSLLILIGSIKAWSQVITYEVRGVKSLTPSVDRLFNSQNHSFANIFCQENPAESAALVLVIDGSSIDGKVFKFPDVGVCNQARSLIMENHKKCPVALLLNSDGQTAQVVVGNCN